MKIAFIGQKGIPARFGGVERHVEELAAELASLGHEVFVYARKNYTPKELKEYRGVKIINLPSIPTKNLDAISHTFFATTHALFSDYDIIHYQAIGPSSLSWIIKLLKRRAVLLSTFHCQDYHHQKWSFLARTYLKIGEIVSCKVPNKTVVISKTLKKYAKLKYRINPVVIPNGANIKFNTGADYLAKWGIEKNKYILVVSRLIRHKGIHYLIEAFKYLKKHRLIPEYFKLVIVGSGFYTEDYVQYLHDMAKGQRDIIFTGNQSDEALDQLFSNAYLFVQPSESEGLSIALLEAMGYGVAPLVSDIKENLDAIGEAGFRFKDKNVEDLSDKLRYLILNHEEVYRKGRLAQKRVDQKFSWKMIAKKTSRVYKSLLLKKKRKYILNAKKING